VILREPGVGDDDLGRADVEERQAILALDPSGMKVVAQPEAERQIARDLPFVLREEVLRPAAPQ
jgi:hypothetical protein